MPESIINNSFGLSDYNLSVLAYFGLGLLILALWYVVVRKIKDPYGLIMWLIAAALIFAPTFTPGANAKIAPAVIGLLFAILSKSLTAISAALVPIFWTLALFFSIAFLIRYIRAHYRSTP